MQIKKEEIENAIITAAEAEFIEKGYKDASLRSIAKKSGVSLSNIYNYFNSKDKLFQQVLKPLLASLNFTRDFLKKHSESEESYSMEFHMSFLEPVINYIVNNKDMLKLLMMNSYGSSYEYYFDDFIEWYTDLSMETIERRCRKNNLKPVKINRFVAHNLIAFWGQFLKEAIMHDIGKEDLLEYTKDLMSFTYSGWEGLIGKKCGIVFLDLKRTLFFFKLENTLKVKTATVQEHKLPETAVFNILNK